MKRICLMMLVALMATMTTVAQKIKNPQGLYRLKSFVYEDGRVSSPGFSQYKYAADSVGLLISYRASRNITQWSGMQVEIREHYPLVNTGETPQGADGHGTQIFNVTDSLFCFKWYNSRWPNMSKLNEFITEIYTKDRMEKEVAKAFDLFENKIAKENKFSGWWVRVAATANPDGTGKRMQVPMIWKAYGSDLSMVVTVMNNGDVLQCNPTSTVRYDNDSTIYEIGHPCKIRWLNDDTHALTFVQENGVPLTELWVRSGLPSKWQRVFNTDLEVLRSGVECMRNAVDKALAGDMKKANQFIAEAVNERNVSIEALGEGIMAIAMNLLVEKRQYKDCKDFCEQQLQVVKDYAAAGHDHTMLSRLYVHLTEGFKAIATYHDGDKTKGKKLVEDKIAEVESEIERYKSIASAERYANLLYYCNFTIYQIGYDILGTERTLLYMDFLPLVAPDMTAQNKPYLLNCRGNCYLLDGDKDKAKTMWQQIKEQDTDFFKRQPDHNPLKQAFGE